MADQNPMQMDPLLAPIPPKRAATRSGLEEITPELIQMAAEYGYLTNEEKRQLLQLKQSQEMRKTPIPGMREYAPGQFASANPMEIAAAAIQQYRGGEESARALQQMQASNMRKQQIDEYGLQQDIARRRNDFQSMQPTPPPPPPTEAEYKATEDAIAERTKGVDLDLGLGAPAPKKKKRKDTGPLPLPPEAAYGQNASPAPGAPIRSPFYGFRGSPPFPLVK